MVELRVKVGEGESVAAGAAPTDRLSTVPTLQISGAVTYRTSTIRAQGWG